MLRTPEVPWGVEVLKESKMGVQKDEGRQKKAQWVWHLWSQLSLLPDGNKTQMETRPRLESFSCGSGAERVTCCPWRGDRKSSGQYFHPGIHSSILLSHDRNKICYIPPPSTERRSNLVKEDPLMRGSHVLRAMEPFSLSGAVLPWPCSQAQVPRSPPKQSKDRLESAEALWKALLISCAAAQQERAVSQWLHLHYLERAPSGAAGNMAHSSSCGLPACGEFVWACLVTCWPARSPWACEVLCSGSGVFLTHLGPFLQAHYLRRGWFPGLELSGRPWTASVDI